MPRKFLEAAVVSGVEPVAVLRLGSAPWSRRTFTTEKFSCSVNVDITALPLQLVSGEGMFVHWSKLQVLCCIHCGFFPRAAGVRVLLLHLVDVGSILDQFFDFVDLAFPGCCRQWRSPRRRQILHNSISHVSKIRDG